MTAADLVAEYRKTYDLPVTEGDSYSFAEWLVTEREHYGPIEDSRGELAVSEGELEGRWTEAQNMFEGGERERKKASALT